MLRTQGVDQPTDRLAVLLDLAGSGQCLVDVGTDHARLPRDAVRQGRFQRAIGIDRRPAALARGRDTVDRARLRDRVALHLSEGLASVRPHQADVVVLAGMGGPTICEILESVPSGVTRLVVQPNSRVSEVRQVLAGRGWRIDDERLGHQRGRLFPTMAWVPGPGHLTLLDAWFGPVLRRRGGPRFAAYRAALIAHLRTVAAHEPHSEAARVLDAVAREAGFRGECRSSSS
jgi:tRNA (adenine22-N1)-methyltransferase